MPPTDTRQKFSDPILSEVLDYVGWSALFLGILIPAIMASRGEPSSLSMFFCLTLLSAGSFGFGHTVRNTARTAYWAEQCCLALEGQAKAANSLPPTPAVPVAVDPEAKAPDTVRVYALK